MPLPALTCSMSFDRIAAVPRSLHWNPVKCYIHFKELLLFSKVLMPSWSPYLICYLLYAPSHKHEITVSGFMGLPLLCLATAALQLPGGVHLSGSSICFTVQRDQSSCCQKSKLEGIGWEPLLIVSKWQSTLGPCTMNGVISTGKLPCHRENVLKSPQASPKTHLRVSTINCLPRTPSRGNKPPTGSKDTGRLGRLQG